MLRVVKNVESYSPSKGGFILPRVFGPLDLCGTVGLWSFVSALPGSQPQGRMWGSGDGEVRLLKVRLLITCRSLTHVSKYITFSQH